MYQGSNAWRQVRVLFVSLASVNVLSSKSTQREVISLSRRSASGEGVSTCRVSNCGRRRSSYHQHMISPQAAPMRCARRDVVAAWNVDVCQNSIIREPLDKIRERSSREMSPKSYSLVNLEEYFKNHDWSSILVPNQSYSIVQRRRAAFLMVLTTHQCAWLRSEVAVAKIGA